jgi:hypothetical protein
MKVADLKNALKARGVSAAGKKADLVARLSAWSPVGALAGKRSPTKTPNPKRAKVKKSKSAKVKKSKPAKKAALTTLEAVAAGDGDGSDDDPFVEPPAPSDEDDAASPMSAEKPAAPRRGKGRQRSAVNYADMVDSDDGAGNDSEDFSENDFSDPGSDDDSDWA